ncbi:30S ribosomal protein S6 [Candidatus Gottesmanbacteria bacterium RIFCSPHIGHO2_02_FULL_39_11]|uniref:Small ribosomal subunit protein bS6 n=1 Tax=Candidatus Gottesmanbacteria bacterium RIFCSPHIGHO2_02_FULL_39_11 TaxID=1798382 RepID=A0A1F5ZWF5_9BACT|nr:MAG: 30S ribosomal protein S6 [Candidatus Gottesmanbacteria bacterium RIFCSPHIGHO2_02_FULL_39_11]
MSQYEMMLIVPADLSDEASQKITGEVKKLIEKEGKLLDSKEWAKNKPLAYPISKHKAGSFWLMTFEAVQKSVPDISGKIKAVPEVVRYLIIKKD